MARRAYALSLCALISGLCLFPATGTGQTSTFHLHKETIATGTYRLVTGAPDASSFVIQSPDLFGLPLSGEYIFAQVGTPAWVPRFTGTIPSGSTVTFSVWMNKTSSASKVYPRAKLSKWDGGTQKTLVCASNSRSNLTTTLVKYVFTCTAGSSVTFAVTDRLLLEVGGNFSTSPGQHNVMLQLYVEGALNGNYDSTVTVPLASSPPPATFAVARTAATATRANTGRVTVVGGANPQVLDTAEEFDPATRLSTVLASPLTVGRARHAATELPDGMVLFTGGLGASGMLGSSELLDPTTQTFGVGPSLVISRNAHTATVLIDSRALILGGESSGGGTTEDERFDASRYSVGAPVYDSTTGQFEVIGSLLQDRRWNHTATTLADGRILITGGRTSAGVLVSAEIIDPSLGTSRLLASTLTSAREGHTATLLPNGSVALVGGSNGTQYLSTVEMFDPASETFSAAAVQLTVARAEHVAMLLAGGVLMVGGGETTTGIVDHVEFLQVLPSDTVTPTVSAVFPAPGTQDRPLTTVIGIRFSEPVDPSTLASITFTAGGTAVPMHVAAGESGLYAFLVAEQPLDPETEYTIQIQGVRDLSGNLLPSAVTSTFTTGAAPDTTPPSVTSTMPANGATIVALDVAPEATFDESLDPASVDSNTVTLSAGGTAVPSTATYAEATHTIRVAATAPLAPATIYTVLLRSGIKDLAGNTMLSDVSWSFTTVAQAPVTALSVSPRGASISVGGSAQFSAILIYGDGTTADVTSTATWTTSDAGIATAAGRAVTGRGPGLASVTASASGVNGSASVQVAEGTPLPPDPAWIAPPLDRAVANVLGDSTAFLYAGSNPVQTGVTPGTIERRRAALLRGSVMTRDNAGLPGATITVVGHPELGSTRSRADGAFDMVVNGGELLTVRYAKAGYVTADRKIDVLWEQATRLLDVALVPYDAAVTVVNLEGAPAVQVARGDIVSDASGSRQTTVIFQPGTTAVFELPDGTTQPVNTAHVRATELTVGPNGPRAMPAVLPATSAYTYAVDLTMDEALAAGARAVRFNQPVPIYVENFLNFPVGGPVPVGYYDPDKQAWVPSNDGRIVRVLAVNGEVADLDIDGSGAPASSQALAALGVTTAELQTIGTLYQAGATLWRVPMTHFTPIDCNWPGRPPEGAEAPDNDDPEKKEDKCDPTKAGASFIGCGNATLGEAIPIAGTPWQLHYMTNRVTGWRTAKEVTLHLTNATPPAPLKQVVLKVDVAGTQLVRSFAPQSNLTFSFAWDGKDAWGRAVQGTVPATIQIGYVYDAVYTQPAGGGRSFSLPSDSFMTLGVAREEITLWQVQRASLGTWDLTMNGTGGWSMTPQHRYDASAHRLHLGDGGERNAKDSNRLAVKTLAGGGDPPPGTNGDGGPAINAIIDGLLALRVGPDGSLYITEGGYGIDSALRRVNPADIITTIGTGLGLVTAVGPDGSLYGADADRGLVWMRAPDGTVSTVAGGGPGTFSGDGGPATEAALWGPQSVALGPDGSLYIADTWNNRIRRVDPQGIITTFAGNGNGQTSGDDGPATQAGLSLPLTVTVGPDGSIYTGGSGVVRRISPDGIITRVAGTGAYGYNGDEIAATTAQVYGPVDLALDQSGRLFMADWNGRIRTITPDGLIHSYAGGGTSSYWEDGPARGNIGTPWAVAVGPSGDVYLGDASRVRLIAPPLPGISVANVVVPSEDGTELYEFDASGRHLHTKDALTGALLTTFSYEDGYLTTITDGDGNLTRLERTGERLNAIVAPGGQRTTLQVDSNGYLSRIANPAGEAWEIESSSEGLVTSIVDPRRGLHSMSYSPDGRVTDDSGPEQGSWTVVRTGDAKDRTSTVTSAEGRVESYRMQSLWGETRKTTTDAASLTTTIVERADGTRVTTTPDGTVTTSTESADPRWAMQVPLLGSYTIRTPSGLTSAMSSARSVVLANPLDPATLQSQTDTMTLNGHTWTTLFDAAARTQTTVSPAGREQTRVFDTKGRVVSWTQAGLTSVQFGYDPQGRLTTITQGTRQAKIAYDAQNRPVTFTDPLQKAVTFGYNAADRITSQTLPDERVIGFGYDASGNVTQVVPPGRPAHGFTYTLANLTQTYTPPTVPGTGATGYAYNRDRQLTRVDRPGGDEVALGYDTGGRLSTMTFDAVTLEFTYRPTGQVETITAPNEALSFTFDGPLPLTSAWTGAVSGVVGQTYTTDFAAATQRVNDTAVSFGYDDDGLLTQAGALTLTRHPDHGSVTGTTLGGVTDQYDWTGYGEPSRYQAHHAAFGSDPIFDAQYTRDDAGRITQIIETIDTIQRVWTYAYDDAGRLATVRRNGDVAASYTYDSNGNRLTYDGDRGHEEGTYDDQDRLLTYGGASYTYAPNGELTTKTVGTQMRRYTYDALGNLRQVEQPDGTLIEYVIDGRNRRVGKKVNGVLVKGWLYADQLRIVAELDGSGAVVSRFVYGSKANVPDYMVRDGVTYRIISDYLGSPRVVLNADTGEVVQRLDFDPFGVVRQDSNPAWQPFGFAGGLYDLETGLVRFGSRDYDATTGAWSSKDPLRFGNGETNLYAYAKSRPTDLIDSDGLDPYPVVVVSGFGGYGIGGGEVGAVYVYNPNTGTVTQYPYVGGGLGLGAGGGVGLQGGVLDGVSPGDITGLGLQAGFFAAAGWSGITGSYWGNLPSGWGASATDAGWAAGAGYGVSWLLTYTWRGRTYRLDQLPPDVRALLRKLRKRLC